MHGKILVSVVILLAQWLPAPMRTSSVEVRTPFASISLIKPIAEPKLGQLAPLDYQPFPFLPMGSHQNTYAPANCTWGASSMKLSVPQDWGNANTWDDRARAEGKTVSNVPIIGAVAETDRGYYGHVAVVTGIENGQAIITEMNFDNNGGVRSRLTTPGEFVFIYI